MAPQRPQGAPLGEDAPIVMPNGVDFAFILDIACGLHWHLCVCDQAEDSKPQATQQVSLAYLLRPSTGILFTFVAEGLLIPV